MLDLKKLKAAAMYEIKDTTRGTGQDHGNPDLAIAWFLKGARYAEAELSGEIEDYRRALLFYADTVKDPLQLARRTFNLYERNSDD